MSCDQDYANRPWCSGVKLDSVHDNILGTIHDLVTGFCRHEAFAILYNDYTKNKFMRGHFVI